MSDLSISDVTFSYGPRLPDVLRIQNLNLSRGEKVFLFGPSGSGKSTLLGLIGGLFTPQRGRIQVLGQDITEMSHSQRDRFRAREIGFIFQVFNLVPYLNVLENVMLPAHFGRPISQGFTSAKDEAKSLLEQLGLGQMIQKSVTELSIGQQQRVAVARALLGSPGLVIADEPTSALDSDTRESFLKMLAEQAKREGSTVLFVSHDRALASAFDRDVALPQINIVSPMAGGDQ
jgi:putative ABC transport system ATP-binding protein